MGAFNQLQLCGMVTSEPIKREVHGRPVVVFHLTTTEPAQPPLRPEKIVLSHTIIVWDGLAEMFMYSYGMGNTLLVTGRISYRNATDGFKCEIVADAVEGLDRLKDGKRVKNTANLPPVERLAAVAQYPAVNENPARVAAETMDDAPDELVAAIIAASGPAL